MGGLPFGVSLGEPSELEIGDSLGLVLDASTGFALRIMLGGSLGLSSHDSLGLRFPLFLEFGETQSGQHLVAEKVILSSLVHMIRLAGLMAMAMN
jgi:hypothetical protein